MTENVLNTCLEDVLKTSCKTTGKRKNYYAKTPSKRLEDVLKTCLEDVLKASLEDAFKTSWRCLLGISVFNKFKCLSNKSISYESKANPECKIILKFVLFSNTSSISFLKIKISEIGGWPIEAIKTKL